MRPGGREGAGADGGPLGAAPGLTLTRESLTGLQDAGCLVGRGTPEGERGWCLGQTEPASPGRGGLGGQDTHGSWGRLSFILGSQGVLERLWGHVTSPGSGRVAGLAQGGLARGQGLWKGVLEVDQMQPGLLRLLCLHLGPSPDRLPSHPCPSCACLEKLLHHGL